MDQVKLLDNLINDKNKFYKELEKVIIGQKEVIDYIFIAFLCRGACSFRRSSWFR